METQSLLHTKTFIPITDEKIVMLDPNKINYIIALDLNNIIQAPKTVNFSNEENEKKNEIIYGANDQNQAQVQSKVDSWGKYGDKYISGEWDNLSPSYVKSYIDSIGGIENAATITGWDQDNFSDKYLNSITSQERAEIVDAIVKGINSIYNGQTDTGVITTSHLYNSSDSINEMTQMEGFRDEEGSVSDSGIEAITLAATCIFSYIFFTSNIYTPSSLHLYTYLFICLVTLFDPK